MPLDKHAISGFLEEVDRELDRGVTLIAVGGTAMTLLDVKPSTIDVDFTVPSDDYDDFQNALKKIPHGFKIDCWKDGMVFSQMLPSDYEEKLRHQKAEPHPIEGVKSCGHCGNQDWTA